MTAEVPGPVNLLVVSALAGPLGINDRRERDGLRRPGNRPDLRALVGHEPRFRVTHVRRMNEHVDGGPEKEDQVDGHPGVTVRVAPGDDLIGSGTAGDGG